MGSDIVYPALQCELLCTAVQELMPVCASILYLEAISSEWQLSEKKEAEMQPLTGCSYLR